MTDEDDDRIEVLYHGTTQRAAAMILAERKFGLRETFFASIRELADYFARRACGRTDRGERPAVIKVPLYHSDFVAWKRSRLFVPSGFDEGDAPELRGKIQLRFTAEGVRQLNVHSFQDEWSILP